MLSRSLRSDARRSQKEETKRQIVSSTAPVRRWEKMTIIVPENGLQVRKWTPLNELAQPITAVIPANHTNGQQGGQKIISLRTKTSKQQYQLGNSQNAPRNILDAFSNSGIMQPGENMTAMNPRGGKSEDDGSEPPTKTSRNLEQEESMNVSSNRDETFVQNDDSLLNNDVEEENDNRESESDDPNTTLEDSKL